MILILFIHFQRAFENVSLFHISSNVFEYQNENYHYLSSRGLGYFLVGLPNLFHQIQLKIYYL